MLQDREMNRVKDHSREETNPEKVLDAKAVHLFEREMKGGLAKEGFRNLLSEKRMIVSPNSKKTIHLSDQDLKVSLLKGVPDHRLEKPEKDQEKKDFRNLDLEKMIRIAFRNSRERDMKGRPKADLIVTKINQEKEVFQSPDLERPTLIDFQNSRKMSLVKRELVFQKKELKGRLVRSEKELLSGKGKIMIREKKEFHVLILKRQMIALPNLKNENDQGILGNLTNLGKERKVSMVPSKSISEKTLTLA